MSYPSPVPSYVSAEAPVNKRVKNYYIGRDSDLKGKGIQQWELTAAEPIKATN